VTATPTRPPATGNPLLVDGGAPTLVLGDTTLHNPTPTQFLKDKFALLADLYATGALGTSAGRREATRYDVFLFALIYVPHYLILDTTAQTANQEHPYGGITLSQFHVDVISCIEEWAFPSTLTRQDRDGFVAPRESGKSSWLFGIGPLWAGAHGHQRFIVAFSDSDDQVQKHLAKFHENIDNNPALKEDFPDLCRPARRANGNAVNDNKNEFVSESGFTFSAHTVDGKIVGLISHENARPTLIILDDIEPSEDKYSPALKAKGVRRLADKILYLNERARVVLVGTVTMAGSIMHDVVQSVLNPGVRPDPALPPPPGNPYRMGSLVAGWIREQNFRGHYYPALSVDPATGELQSLWPEKWPVVELAPRLGTNDFMKNMQNNPVGSGDFWEMGDIVYTAPLTGVTRTILVLDPAVTATDTSDYTGVAVIRFQPASRSALTPAPTEPHPTTPAPPDRAQLERQAARRGRRLPPNPTPAQVDAFYEGLLLPTPTTPTDPTSPATSPADPTDVSRCEIAFANRVKMKPHRLRAYAAQLLTDFPEIDMIYIETNQGQDFVVEPFSDFPVRLVTVTQSEPKDVRIARLAQFYKSLRPRVLHSGHFIPLEEEMYAYPQTANDDTVDAAASGVNYFLDAARRQRKTKKVRRGPRLAETNSYMPSTHRRAS
jgi:hypothetical protein